MCQLPPQQHSTPRSRFLSFCASRGPRGRAVCRDSRRAKDCTLMPARFRCSGEKEMTVRKRWLTPDLRGKLKARVFLSAGAGSAHSILTSARSAQTARRRHRALLVKSFDTPRSSVIPLSAQTAQARPFMLLCAPGFSPAFVGLKGPAASRDPHLRCTGFCSLTVPTAPEARRPQSHAPSSPSSVRGSWGRWHKSLNQSSPPQPPAPEGSRLLHPPSS